MSTSRQAPSSSNSPSKPSLRRTSSNRTPASTSIGTSGPTTHFASQATQHHFLPHSPPNQNLEYEDSDEEGEDDNEVAVQSAETYDTRSITQPPPFQPFFTLVEDVLNNEHYHPTIHYIFSDDDTEIITEAACRSLEQEEVAESQSSQNKKGGLEDDDEEEQPEDTEPPRLPKPVPGVKEHYLILDVHPQLQPRPSISAPEAGTTSYSPVPPTIESHIQSNRWTYTVSSSSSLSPHWQVIRSTVTDAPTMLDADPQDTNELDNLMLRIEGRGTTPPESNLQPKAEKESMEEMIDKFQKRLAEIKLLIDAGGEDLGDQQRQHQVQQHQEESQRNQGAGQVPPSSTHEAASLFEEPG